MKVKSVKIENLMGVKYWEANTDQAVVKIEEKQYKDILIGVSKIALNNLFYYILENINVNKDMRVSGEFVYAGEKYFVESLYNTNYKEETIGSKTFSSGMKTSETIYKNGAPINLGRLHGELAISADENAFNLFSNNKPIQGEHKNSKDFSIFKLNFQEHDWGFAKEIVDEEIANFTPIPINSKKNLFVDYNGAKQLVPVLIESGQKTVACTLSESDETIFNYLCFIVTNCIICKYFNKNNMRMAKKPFFIFNFVQYLDKDVNVDKLLKLATDLGHQVFLFTESK